MYSDYGFIPNRPQFNEKNTLNRNEKLNQHKETQQNISAFNFTEEGYIGDGQVVGHDIEPFDDPQDLYQFVPPMPEGGTSSSDKKVRPWDGPQPLYAVIQPEPSGQPKPSPKPGDIQPLYAVIQPDPTPKPKPDPGGGIQPLYAVIEGPPTKEPPISRKPPINRRPRFDNQIQQTIKDHSNNLNNIKDRFQ